MIARLRRLSTAAALTFGLALLAFGGAAAWLHRARTPTSMRLAGLSRPADVIWDQNAVPHIFAGSMVDAYRLLGFVHARDRLWQMEIQRRTAQGRMAEIFGAGFLASDRMLRGLGVYRHAEADARRLAPQMREELEAYASGVNAYAAAHRDDLPGEFRAAAVWPEAWRPADSLAWFRLISLDLSYGYGTKALRASLAKKVSQQTFDILFPRSDPTGPTTLATRDVDWIRLTEQRRSDLRPAQASNEWVVDGSRAKSGKPLLANDPHLALSAPIVWYLARIDTPDGTRAGATVPGVPFHILGHNGRIAWGMTDAVADSEDLFAEKLDPTDPNRYLTPNGPAAFVRRTEIIRVRSQPDVRLEIRESRHGPIISDLADVTQHSLEHDDVVSLAFLGLGDGNGSPAALRELNRAADWAAFKAALGDWETPALNFIYADRVGNIGFACSGILPKRKQPGADFPVAGWSGANDWLGIIRSSELPSMFNPATHNLVNANNRVVSDASPIYIARHYGLPLRAERITHLLESRHLFTSDDFVRMQNDSWAGDAKLLLPRLLTVHPTRGSSAEAHALLRRWDQTMDRDRPEPLIFMSWVFQLQRNLLVRRLGPAAAQAVGLFDYDPYLILRLIEREEADGDGRDHVATLLESTLERAIDDLTDAYGPNVSSWRWGRAHTAGLAMLPQMGSAASPSGERLPAVSGGAHTVNAQVPKGGSGIVFTSVQGPGFRAVYDLQALDASRFVIATGESGEASSPHFADMTATWRNGGTITLAGSLAEVSGRASDRLHVSP